MSLLRLGQLNNSVVGYLDTLRKNWGKPQYQPSVDPAYSL